jgi:hypothetical protein
LAVGSLVKNFIAIDVNNMGILSEETVFCQPFRLWRILCIQFDVTLATVLFVVRYRVMVPKLESVAKKKWT